VTQYATAVLYTEVTLHPPWWIGDSILHSCTVYRGDIISSLIDFLVLRIRWFNPPQLYSTVFRGDLTSFLMNYLELRIRRFKPPQLYCILRWPYILPHGLLGAEDMVTQSFTAVLYTEVTLHPSWWIIRSWGYGDSILHSCTVYWGDLTSSLMDY
jgi:hypothetical protein